MATRVGINGFGRIGRNFFRAQQQLGADIEIVALNDLGDARTMAHLLKYDPVLGPFAGDVALGDGVIEAGGETMKMLSERDPAGLPWATSASTSCSSRPASSPAARRTEAPRRRREEGLISAPATDPDITLVLGVNDGAYDPDTHHIVSNASCTTNCVAPLAKVIDDLAGIEPGFMTTIHAYTNDQNILDLTQDLRRARRGDQPDPDLDRRRKGDRARAAAPPGKVDGISVRVCVPTCSLTDSS